jgi:hypothetical protein
VLWFSFFIFRFQDAKCKTGLLSSCASDYIAPKSIYLSLDLLYSQLTYPLRAEFTIFRILLGSWELQEAIGGQPDERTLAVYGASG